MYESADFVAWHGMAGQGRAGQGRLAPRARCAAGVCMYTYFPAERINKQARQCLLLRRQTDGRAAGAGAGMRMSERNWAPRAQQTDRQGVDILFFFFSLTPSLFRNILLTVLPLFETAFFLFCG